MPSHTPRQPRVTPQGGCHLETMGVCTGAPALSLARFYRSCVAAGSTTNGPVDDSTPHTAIELASKLGGRGKVEVMIG